MKTLCLIACSKLKLSVPLRAEDLYTASPLFRKCRQYAEQQRYPDMILSAWHGLVDPQRIITPYQLCLDELSRGEQKEWARRVLTGLRGILESGDKVIFLAGNTYRRDLVSPLDSWGVQVEIPMQGLEIGEMGAWLSKKPAWEAKPTGQLELI